MINLKDSAGLPIVLNDDEKTMQLEFEGELIVETVKKREIREMMAVLMDKPKIPKDRVIYKMYDGVYLQKDRNSFKKKRLRYDLTLIYPGKLGREFIKTAGHYHSISEDSSFSYPELYEVLDGEVHFILQRKGHREDEIEDLVVIQASRGQRIIVPPNYGHVAVNPGGTPLVLANWIAEDCKPDYRIISRYGGSALYEVEEQGKPQFIINKNYCSVPKHRTIAVNQSLTAIFKLDKEIPLYNILLGDPDSLDWLRYPSGEIKKFEDYIGNKVSS